MKRLRSWLMILIAMLVPAVALGVPDVITRDTTQVPCPAIDSANSECRNLRYDVATTALHVNVRNTTVATTGSITPADALTNPTVANQAIALNSAWNGGAWDRQRAANLTNMPPSINTSARNSIGAVLVEKGSRWGLTSNPAAGSQATATINAEASVRHVVDCIAFSAAATVAPAATALTINLRDGASGGGTILWTYQVVATAGTGNLVPAHSMCGLGLVGSTNTATTFEFSAGLANLVESVSFSGYNIN